jgi:lysozyme
MDINNAGTDLIKSFEACRLTVYKDLVGYPTVGWGSRTTLPVGTAISQDEANSLLDSDIKRISDGVKACIRTVINDNQFSALVCLAYNIGGNAFAHSTLAKLINSGELTAAANEFEKWDKAEGIVVPGLLRRRLAEKALFLS